MNVTHFDSFKLTVDGQDLRKRFLKVYEYVITNNFLFNNQLVSDAKEILSSAQEGPICKADLPSSQLAFLLSSGVQDTCLSVQKFYDSLKERSEIIDPLSKNRRIKLCCLESESLPTVVGVCQVIDELIQQFGLAGSFDFSEIKVTVFDKRRDGWERLCGFIVDAANSYFRNIVLKLDFVDDFTSNTSDVFIDRIQESDLVIIARVCVDHLAVSLKNFHEVVLMEMKKNAILFYFDASCKTSYKKIRRSISTTNLFSEVKSCQNLDASFEDLGNEEHCLDLPINWHTNFHPIMFLIWVKCKEIKGLKTEGAQVITDAVNDSNTPTKQMTVPKNKKTQSSKEHPVLTVCDSPTIEGNSSEKGKKSRSASIPDIPNKQKIDTKANKNAESSPKSQYVNASSIADILQKIPKVEYQNISLTTFNHAIFPVTKATVPTIKTKVGTSKLSDAFEKIITPNKGNSGIQIENGDRLDLATTSKNTNQGNSSKIPGKNNTTPKKKAAKKNSVTSKNVSISATQRSPTNLIVDGNASASVKKVAMSKKEDKDQFPEKPVNSNPPAGTATIIGNKIKQKKSSIKNVPISATQKGNDNDSFEKSVKNSASKTFSSKVEPKSSSKNVLVPATEKIQSKKISVVKLTKKSSKNNATEKVKLTGKFARMDLEKKNKDERHRIRAKKASFLKHANFDYDD